jgi:Tol biopolymer transport system component
MPQLLVIMVGAAVVFVAAQGSLTDRPLGGNPSGQPSPDGQLVARLDSDRRQLEVDDIRTGQPLVRQPLGNYIGSTAISYDGKWVAFSSGITGQGAGLRILPIPSSPGDSPRLLVKGADVDPIEWSRDGTAVVAMAETSQGLEIRLITVADGSFRTLRPTSGLRLGASAFGSVALSPDGLHLAVDARAAGTNGRRAVLLLSATGAGEIRLLEPTAWHSVIGWMPDGRHLIVMSDRGGSAGLWAIPVQDGRRAGEPRLVKAELADKPLAVLANGDLVYERVTGPPAARLVTARVDADMRVTSPPTPFPTRHPLAFARFPRWSADGRSFMYVETSLLGPVAVIHTDGTSNSRTIPLDLSGFFTFDWSRDGRQIVFKGTTRDGEVRLCLLDISRGVLRVLPTLPLQEQGAFYHPQFDATGTSVSYFRAQGQPVTWAYVERALDSNAVRVVAGDLSRLMGAPRSYPAGRSPDGRYLLAEVAGDPSRLLAYDTKTTAVREVFRSRGTEAFHHYGDIQWTPDSRAIITTVATTLHEEGNEQELWWMPVDGRAPRQIDVGTTLIGENRIAVHPGGGQIAFVAGRPFSGVLPLDYRPRAAGSPIERRVISGIAAMLQGGR